MDEKSNETSAIPELLSHFYITDCVVTVDLNTQTKLVETTVTTEADYIFAVKGNQATLFEDLQLLFDGFEQGNYDDVLFETVKSISEAHGLLDIAFREDSSRIRQDYASQNMTVLRHIVLNLLKQEASAKVDLATKRKMAG